MGTREELTGQTARSLVGNQTNHGAGSCAGTGIIWEQNEATTKRGVRLQKARRCRLLGGPTRSPRHARSAKQSPEGTKFVKLY